MLEHCHESGGSPNWLAASIHLRNKLTLVGLKMAEIQKAHHCCQVSAWTQTAPSGECLMLSWIGSAHSTA